MPKFHTGFFFICPLLALACGGGADSVVAPPPPPVVPVAAVSVQLPVSALLPGQSAQATAIVRDAQGNALTGRAVTWNSSNVSVATVSSSGLVTAVVGGDPVTITATSEGVSGAAAVTITPTSFTITTGGTYSGSWQSLDPAVPALTISTTDPVIIQNCTIRSKGLLIQASAGNAHVTVKNCHGYGLDPAVAGKSRGDFFYGFKIGSLTVENNYMEAVNYGIRLYGQVGWVPNGPISIRFNQAKNLDGLASDGQGGRQTSNLQFGQDAGNHFFIITNSNGIPALDVSWNDILNEPYTSSIGDVINIYSSSGSAIAPIQIHDNFIQGGYGADPFATNYVAGGITLDGSATDLPSTATAFVRVHDNQIVNHSNFAIGLASGHDNEAYGNRAVSTGKLADGRWVMMTYGSGIYVWNCTCYNQPPTVFFNNFVHDNVSGWEKPGTPSRADYFLPDCAGGSSGPTSKCTNNMSLPDPITATTEANERALWLQKVSANNIKLGPSQ